MTFREVKQLVEIVRNLGYPTVLGVDSFDTPNFGLMAQLLHWLSQLYDPDIVVISELSTEAGRVEFVRSIVQQMAVRSGIRLNPRKLYGSDRMAVRELLKIAGPVYRGITAVTGPEPEGITEKPVAPSAKKISQSSSTVPKHAVELYDQLEKELMIREPRTKVLSTMPPLDEVQKSVQAAVEDASARLDSLTKELDRLTGDEDTLRTKIKQRRHELERQGKRLMSVQTIRPAFMDEYEGLERELQQLFEVHFQHYRNVDYYEHELQLTAERQKIRRAELDKQMGKMKRKVGKDIVEKLGQSFDPTKSELPNAPEGEDLCLTANSDDSF
jgi:clusterin-associated protein 1